MKRRMISIMLFVVMCMQLLATSASAVSVQVGETTDPIVASWQKWNAVNGYNYKVTQAVTNNYYVWDRYNSKETWNHKYTYRKAKAVTQYTYDVDRTTYKLAIGPASEDGREEVFGTIWVAKSLSGPWTTISYSQAGSAPYTQGAYPYLSEINPLNESQDTLAKYYGDETYGNDKIYLNWGLNHRDEIWGDAYYWEVTTSSSENYKQGSTTNEDFFLFTDMYDDNYYISDIREYGQWVDYPPYEVKITTSTVYEDPGRGSQYTTTITNNSSTGYATNTIQNLNGTYGVILDCVNTFVSRAQGSANGTVKSMTSSAYPINGYDSKTNKFYVRRSGTTPVIEDSGKWLRNECLSSSTTTGLHQSEMEFWTFINQGYGPGNINYGDVTSTSATQYPNNGKSGSYWYIKNEAETDKPTLTVKQNRTSTGVQLFVSAEDKSSDVYIMANGQAYETPLTLFSNSVETVNLYAQDVWGNKSDIQNVAIDAVGPDIYVEYDPPNNGDLAESVTATISVVDTSGLDANPIKIGNGEWQKNDAQYHFDKNGTVVVYAKDSLGNVSSFAMTVDWIDLEPPTITRIVPDVEGFTNGNIKLKAEAKDDVGLDAKPYLWGTYSKDNPSDIEWIGEYSASDTYTVTSNIGVALKVRDRAGKESEVYTYYVENIDRTAPVIDNYQTSVPLTSAINPNDGITITINAHDPSDSITNTSAGLVNDYVYWNGAWGGRSNTFYSPGTLVIKVRDAAGNISAPITVTIPSVDSDGPEITSFTGTHMGKAWTVAPVTLTVTARDTDGSALPKQCYSWDGGKTWTSLNTKKVTENGEYNVMVRDKVGNTVSDSIIVSNIDSEKPTANVYLAKVHSDPSDADSDLIWKVYVDVADQISGVDYVKTLWDGGTHADVFPIVQEVTTTGMYGVIVVDKAGNETYTYLTVTNEMLGNEAPGSGTNSEYVNTVLNPNIDGLGTEWSDPSNLVYGPDGMYNKSTGNYKSYSDVSVLNGNKGVFLQVNLTSKSGTWTTGVAKLNGVDYPLTFDKFGGSMEISAEPTTGYVFIPISNIHQDVKNGRLKILISEWSDESKTENIRSGSLQIYVSVQKTQPIISYNYNRTTGKLTLNPVSTVAGIKEVLYSLDGSTPSVEYSAPFTVPTGSTIKIKATDKVNQITDLTLDSDSLSLNGSSDGMNSEAISGTYSLTSYSISTRTMDSYLINGSQSNTDQVPSSAVLDLFN